MTICLFSYSFLSACGTGFEAFFTPNGHLVVAIVTRKEYVTAPLVDVVLADDLWVGHVFEIFRSCQVQWNKLIEPVY
jgi:hypothetical protein